MKLQQLLMVFLWIIFPSLSFAANHYVDCSAAKNGNGSFASPWNNLATVNSRTFATGDGLYFKVGTTCYLNSDNDRVRVRWNGTGENNRAIIGAYYGNGLFGLNGNPRPIIDGRSQYPGTEQAGIEMSKRSYVTVKDLKIQNIGRTGTSRGVMVLDSNSINTENCHMYRTRGPNMVYMRVNTGRIIYNICENSKYPDYTRGGAAIEVSAGNKEGATTNILVARNKVFNGSYEGIGLYKKVTNSIVEYNIVKNIKSFMIYIDAGKGNIIRHNLVYKDTSNSFNSWAIAVCNENFHKYLFSGNNQIYGNMIAGTRRGISLGCEIQKTYPNANCHPNTKVYNNTIVDAEFAFTIDWSSPKDNVDIKNNISWTLTSGFYHMPAKIMNAAGTTWSHNLFYGGQSVTGKAATNMISINPMLPKTSGWRNISPNSLTGREFLPGNSRIFNGGTTPPGSGLITASNFTASPIQVTIQKPVSSFPIGAWILPDILTGEINPPTMKTIELLK
jgi:hypothetical protein